LTCTSSCTRGAGPSTRSRCCADARGPRQHWSDTSHRSNERGARSGAPPFRLVSLMVFGRSVGGRPTWVVLSVAAPQDAPAAGAAGDADTLLDLLHDVDGQLHVAAAAALVVDDLDESKTPPGRSHLLVLLQERLLDLGRRGLAQVTGLGDARIHLGNALLLLATHLGEFRGHLVDLGLKGRLLFRALVELFEQGKGVLLKLLNARGELQLLVLELRRLLRAGGTHRGVGSVLAPLRQRLQVKLV